MFYKESKKRPVITCDDGLTKQSMRDETDINLIMAKYQKTGMINFVNSRKGEYMEVPDVDFQTAMDAVVQGNQMFADMPSNLRKQFNNDPGQFMDFVHNPENKEAMYELGLAERPEGWVPPGEKGGEAAQAEGETPSPGEV